MTWANFITLGRLFSAPLIVWLIFTDEAVKAFWITLVAGFSDILDGLVARLFKVDSVIGAYLDPLADKVLLVSIYISLALKGMIPLWLVIAVVFRDILILGGVLLIWGLGRQIKIQPLFISKINTFFQIISVVFILAVNAYNNLTSIFSLNVLMMLFYLTAITTFLSALGYIKLLAKTLNDH
ncbi:MAG: CDP-alcohol phosphatidyltransferase family protein [Janthinobacterium lividum]